MHFFRSLLLLCPLALLTAQTPPPQAPPQPTVTLTSEPIKAMPPVDPDKVVLTVGDSKITAAQFELLVQTLPAQYQVNARGPGRKQFADSIVKVMVLAEEGKRRKIDETAAYKMQSMFQNSNLLAGRAFEQINQEKNFTEEDIRKYYDEHRAEFEQVRGRHILIRMKDSPVPVRPGQKDLSEEESLAKATELHKRIVAGEDFVALARAESDDVSSGANGGELGPFRRNTMVPAFEEVAFKLKPGEFSEPLKTQFGYHIIRVDERKDFTFEDAKPEVEKKLKPDAARKMVEELEKKGNAVFDPEFFSLPKQ